MSQDSDLLKQALDAGRMSDFLIGDEPYFVEGRQEFPEPQNVSQAMLLQIAPYWRLTKDPRLPNAFRDGLLQLIETYPDRNKALYVCSNWLRAYYYGLQQKREQEPVGAYAGLFEIDLSSVAERMRQELEKQKAALLQDTRWAGAAWNSPTGLWGAITRNAVRTRDQFAGLDFVPRNAESA